jgi:hypothetical protein
MNYQPIWKNLIHTILTVIFVILTMFILMAKLNWIWGSIIILMFLLLWKLISGLANINYFILYSLFISTLIFSWNFKMVPVISFLIIMIVLFYFRVIDIKPIIKDNLSVFLTFKQWFLFLVFFYNTLAIYCLFYLNHIKFFYCFVLYALTSYVCFSWYKKLNNLNWSLYEKIVIFLIFLQMSWIVFHFSNGFFIFPILLVLWFYNLTEIYRHISLWNANKTINLVIIPLIITFLMAFVIKL